MKCAPYIKHGGQYAPVGTRAAYINTIKKLAHMIVEMEYHTDNEDKP